MFFTDFCSGILMLNYAGLHRFVELTKEALKVKSLSFPDYIVSNVCSVKCLRWGSPPTKLSGLIDITPKVTFLTKVRS